MYNLSFSSISFTTFGALVFGAQMLRIEKSFWLMLPLSMKCSQPLLINCDLKSILLDIIMAILACFLGPFA